MGIQQIQSRSTHVEPNILGGTGPLIDKYFDTSSVTEVHGVRSCVIPPGPHTEKYQMVHKAYDNLENRDLYTLEMKTILPNKMDARIVAVCSDGCRFEGALEYEKVLKDTKTLLREGYKMFGEYASNIKSSELAPDHRDSFTATVFVMYGGIELPVATLSADIIPISNTIRRINQDSRITGLDLISNARESIYEFAKSINMPGLEYVVELNSLVLLNPDTRKFAVGRHLGTDYTLGLSKIIMDWVASRLDVKQQKKTCIIAIMDGEKGDQFRRMYRVPYYRERIIETTDVKLNPYFEEYFNKTSRYWIGQDKYSVDDQPVVALFGNSFPNYLDLLLNWEESQDLKLIEN